MIQGSECIFSVDVEDWFHILETSAAPTLDKWAALPSHVEACFRRLLSLFDEKGVRVTCFFLGWVADRFPQLVKEAAAAGHEIACHGYGHVMIDQLTEQQFQEDIRRAKWSLEDLVGEPVIGYRSPGFSITCRAPWFYDSLTDVGFKYDSSVFPGRSRIGDWESSFDQYAVPTKSTPILEFPITVVRPLRRLAPSKAICMFGGGYLRLYPYFLIRKMARRVLDEHRSVVFYIHPREIDPHHPRLPMSLRKRFKSYVNLKSTEPKLRQILDDFPITTFASHLARLQRHAETAHA